MGFLKTVAISLLSMTFMVEAIKNSPLEVRLSHISGSVIRVSVTNVGNTALSLLTPNTILDRLPVEKVKVYSKGYPLTFYGVHSFVRLEGLPNHAFLAIQPHMTLNQTIDISEAFDLSTEKAIDVIATGKISFALRNTSIVVGDAFYSSNRLTLRFMPNSQQSRLSPLKLFKRAKFSSDCSRAQVNSITEDIKIANAWATAAVDEAQKLESPAWKKYFRIGKNDSTPKDLQEYHSLVTKRFKRVAKELSLTPRGVSTIFCNPKNVRFPDGAIDPCTEFPNNTIAFTLAPTCQIGLCPLFWTIPKIAPSCLVDIPHDKPMVFIHELTHCKSVAQIGLQPPTEDFAYNYHDINDDAIMPPGWSIQNAESYCLFAKAAGKGGEVC